MAKLMYEVDHAVLRVTGDVLRIRDDRGHVCYREGVLTTPFGMVNVYIQPNRDGGEFVVLSTVIHGREYRQCERRPRSERLTDRGVKIVAHRWIRRMHHRVNRQLSQ